MSSVDPVPHRISLSQALSESYGYFFKRFGHILRISWQLLAAMVVALLIFMCIASLLPPLPTTPGATIEPGVFWLHWITTMSFGIVLMLIYLAFFIVVARDYLLNEKPPRFAGVYPAVLLRTIALLFILMACIVAITFPAMLVAGTALNAPGIASKIIGVSMIVLAMIGSFYVMSRWSTWIVSHAVGRPQNLGEAWNSTSKSAFKIIAGVIVIGLSVLPVAIVLGLAGSLIQNAVGPVTPGTLSGQALILLFLLAAVQFLVLQILYVMFFVFITNVFSQLYTPPAQPAA
jgi:hypothetical protein